jgi:hypothetical protein
MATPTEKLARRVETYATALAAVKAAPSDRDLRNKASFAKAAVKTCAVSFRLTMPDLEPLPELPDPKPHFRPMPPALEGRAKRELDPLPVEPVPSVDLVLDEFLPKAGPGPYVPPTAEDLLAEMQRRGQEPESVAAATITIHASETAHISPAGAEQIRKVIMDAERDGGRRRLEFHAPTPAPEPEPERTCTAVDLARDIQRAFWPLCQAIDSMDDRTGLRPALDAIHARIQIAYALVDEGDVAQAG